MRSKTTHKPPKKNRAGLLGKGYINIYKPPLFGFHVNPSGGVFPVKSLQIKVPSFLHMVSLHDRPWRRKGFVHQRQVKKIVGSFHQRTCTWHPGVRPEASSSISCSPDLDVVKLRSFEKLDVTWGSWLFFENSHNYTICRLFVKLLIFFEKSAQVAQVG